jgi:hypothetical protein
MIVICSLRKSFFFFNVRQICIVKYEMFCSLHFADDYYFALAHGVRTAILMTKTHRHMPLTRTQPNLESIHHLDSLSATQHPRHPTPVQPQNPSFYPAPLAVNAGYFPQTQPVTAVSQPPLYGSATDTYLGDLRQCKHPTPATVRQVPHRVICRLHCIQLPCLAMQSTIWIYGIHSCQ